MNMKKILGCAIIAASFWLSAASMATVADADISLTPSTQSIMLGNTVTVELGISRLGWLSPTSLSVFDINVTFDASILDFNSVVFGDPVWGDQLDLFGLGSFTNVFTGVGFINLFELSFDFASDLDSFQIGDFTLATITFDSLAAGFSALDIFVNDIGDAHGSALSATVSGANVEVIDNSVSEPGVLFLFGLGVAVLALVRRRKQSL